jgi:RsmE family RNA methyltransferase
LDFSKNVNIFIWPEWWFTKKENDLFLKNNFTKVNLWRNILRTENAPIVVW